MKWTKFPSARAPAASNCRWYPVGHYRGITRILCRYYRETRDSAPSALLLLICILCSMAQISPLTAEGIVKSIHSRSFADESTGDTSSVWFPRYAADVERDREKARERKRNIFAHTRAASFSGITLYDDEETYYAARFSYRCISNKVGPVGAVDASLLFEDP